MISRQPGPPRPRTILAVDIEGSTTRTNTGRADLRAVTYALIEASLAASGITAECRDPLVDRGDGVLVLIHPVDQAPKTLLLSKVIPTLGALLAEHGLANPDHRVRMRAVLHAGEIHRDGWGLFGEALDVAFRLLDARETKKLLRDSTSPLVLVVSELIYRSIVQHGYAGIDEHGFVRLVRTSVGGWQDYGWGWEFPTGDRDLPTGLVGRLGRRRRGVA